MRRLLVPEGSGFFSILPHSSRYLRSQDGRARAMPRNALTVMVSSTVYGSEPLLDQVYATLKGYGYTVWMSYKGTIPVNPKKDNFANCLEAVEQCDIFLGIITGRYGSGVKPDEKSITHQEMMCAVAKDKLRWFLVHRDVTIARDLLKQFRFRRNGSPKRLKFQRTSIIEDLRVLEMYECAIQDDRPLAKRTGNWVQSYTKHADALDYIQAQFKIPKRCGICWLPEPWEEPVRRRDAESDLSARSI